MCTRYVLSSGEKEQSRHNSWPNEAGRLIGKISANRYMIAIQCGDIRESTIKVQRYTGVWSHGEGRDTGREGFQEEVTPEARTSPGRQKGKNLPSEGIACAAPKATILGEVRDLYAVKHAGEPGAMGA